MRIRSAKVCPNCNQAPAVPARVFGAEGEVVEGCVDHFHTGHLIPQSASGRWHSRTAARRLRRVLAQARGSVTVFP